VVYHPDVQKDVGAILKHYDHISPKLGDAFWEEMMLFVRAAEQNPERYRLVTSNFRRANLKRFPHHFLFRQVPGGIRILVVRHHQSHPLYGTERR
jgi:hypothetical protein